MTFAQNLYLIVSFTPLVNELLELGVWNFV